MTTWDDGASTDLEDSGMDYLAQASLPRHIINASTISPFEQVTNSRQPRYHGSEVAPVPEASIRSRGSGALSTLPNSDCDSRARTGQTRLRISSRKRES